MTTTDSFQALRRANPRARADFPASVELARELVADALVAASVEKDSGRRRNRGLVRLSAAGVAVAVAVTAFVSIVDLGGGTGVADATAAFRQAATVTAASAERSGTAVVRIVHDGELWAGTTIRWNGSDVAIAREATSSFRPAGDELRVVDGILYGPDPEVEGGWLAMGSPRNIDPDSGTTPDEYLAAVREDLGGVTLRRFTNGVTGLTRSSQADGSALYRGTVAAGLIARETGFKEGQAIRVFPFGYVAHDEAADPASRLDVAVSVGADGIVRQIAVTWGTWRYTVTYSELGTTRAPVAPANARDLLKERLAPQPPTP